MALPDYSYLVAGTALTWQASGGDKVLTMTSLASGSARAGDKSATLLDGTLGKPELLDIVLETKAGSAVTNGLQTEIYIGESSSATAGTDNPGGLSGSDAAYANPSEKKLQLNYVGGFNYSNALGTGAQRQRFTYAPLAICIIPVIVNNSGQSFSGTAGDHILTITPYYRKLAD